MRKDIDYKRGQMKDGCEVVVKVYRAFLPRIGYKQYLRVFLLTLSWHNKGNVKSVNILICM